MYDLLLLGVALVWGLNYVVMKVGLRELDAGAFTLLRFLGATPLMFALVRIGGEDWRLPRRDWARAVVVGVLGTAFYQTLFAAALQYTTAANVSLLLAVSPGFTALMGWATGRDRPRLLTVAGLAAAFVGAGLVIANRPDAHLGFTLTTLKGDLFGLAASVLWAAYAVIAQPLLTRHSGTKVSAYAGLFGSVGLLAVYGGAAAGIPWTQISPGAWGSLTYSIVLATVFGLVTFYHSIARLGPTRVMAYMSLMPAAAIALAAVFLHERLTLIQIIGALLAMGGVWLVRRGAAGSQLPAPRVRPLTGA